MKTTILISVYDMEIGGIERSLVNMLESFDYGKYEVDLLVCSHQGEFMPLIPRRVNLLPEVGRYSFFRKPLRQCIREGHYTTALVRIIARMAADAKAKRRRLEEGSGYIQMQLVSKHAARFLPAIRKRYDVAISYAWPHDLVAKRVRADKKIAWIHTDYSKLGIDNKLDRRMWARFDYIAAVSEACAGSFLEQYPTLATKVKVIENIASPAFIRSMAEQPDGAPEMERGIFSILSVGRLSYVKGFDMAVEALPLLKQRGFDELKWYVVGYGGYESELNALIERYGLRDCFILLGKKENPYPYMQSCDLYVQPSRYEGKAVTVTEAQIVGKPVLITGYPTASSQVRDGYDGIICELSPEGIADGIEALYRSPELRHRLSRNLTEQDYGNAGELEKLYELLGARADDGRERGKGGARSSERRHA